VSSRGEINGWRCDVCGQHTYCVHVDDGVTPMFLGCRAGTVGCKGTGVSLMYPSPPYPQHVLDAVAWEWFRPSRRATRRMEAGMRDHIEKGGLELRPLTDAGRRVVDAAKEKP
jgi:hypothetical protein